MCSTLQLSPLQGFRFQRRALQGILDVLGEVCSRQRWGALALHCLQSRRRLRLRVLQSIVQQALRWPQHRCNNASARLRQQRRCGQRQGFWLSSIRNVPRQMLGFGVCRRRQALQRLGLQRQRQRRLPCLCRVLEKCRRRPQAQVLQSMPVPPWRMCVLQRGKSQQQAPALSSRPVNLITLLFQGTWC